MSIRENIKLKTIKFISETLPNKNKDDLECIGYGIEIFLCNILKVILLFILSYKLGIFKYFLISFVSMNSLRLLSGGVHAKKSWTCFLLSIFVFFSPIYISRFIIIKLVPKIISFIISFILIILYAPADLEEKPYVNPKLRKILKIGSSITSILLMILSMVIKQDFYSNIIFLSIIINSLLITPFVYRLFKRRFRNYEHYNMGSSKSFSG
ncbi:accessory gene regulator B family protein [Alkaliphilus sp. B6464]|uniref:accessory gene regulator B family protein n=1 Tax=Alkaliphilus sp. B6464 TaxID=2731219 RepID=UPI001BA90FBE|nr:accessory gene regulator B family protein [Alkaliphilus sp. B6464]